MSLPDNIKIYKNPTEESYWRDIYELVTKVEKWFNTPNDYDIWRNGFGEDFSLFIAVDTDKNKGIGSASSVNYKTLDGKELLTCNGMVCVHPDYRGKNIGLALSNMVMSKDSGYENKSLIAVPSMSKKYVDLFGFSIIPEDNMTDIEFDVEGIDIDKTIPLKCTQIKFPEENDWDLIYKFDREILGNTQRDKFLKLFCTQENSYFKVSFITSFGFFNPYNHFIDSIEQINIESRRVLFDKIEFRDENSLYWAFLCNIITGR